MIEAATIEDVPRLVELGALMHAEAPNFCELPFSRVKVAQTLVGLIQGGGVVFVARRGGEIVGGIAGGVAPNWFNDELQGFELAVFLAPEARHGLTAMRLVRAFFIWCQARGARRVRMGITTGVHTDSTARFYRALGMQDAGVFFDMNLEDSDVHGT